MAGIVRSDKVERFHIAESLVLLRDEALALHQELGAALNLPVIESKGCNDRYSHSAHWWEGGQKQYHCTGRSFDAT